MQATASHKVGVNTLVMAITVIFILLGSFASGVLSQWEPFLVLGMMLLLGLPHGATDHGLFLALQSSRPTGKRINFYFAYLSVIAAYGLVWFVLPVVAFLLFMLLSVYHFGQSNWVNIDHGHGGYSRAHYLVWGAGILLTPILLHAGEAISIVGAMTGTTLASQPSTGAVHLFIAAMGLLNFAFIGLLHWRGRISTRVMLSQLLVYCLLIAMFFTNSLLLGFTVYFVFWHSLASANDQIKFFKSKLSPALSRQLYTEIAMTVAGALLFCLIVWFGPGPEVALRPAVIGGVFIFISLLTLPHMLLVEQLYSGWSPNPGRAALAPEQKTQHSIMPHPAKLIQNTAGQGITITQ